MFAAAISEVQSLSSKAGAVSVAAGLVFGVIVAVIATAPAFLFLASFINRAFCIVCRMVATAVYASGRGFFGARAFSSAVFFSAAYTDKTTMAAMA